VYPKANIDHSLLAVAMKLAQQPRRDMDKSIASGRRG
jgi:hypothetical protein